MHQESQKNFGIGKEEKMVTMRKHVEEMLEKIVADAEKNGSDKVMMPIVTTEEARFLRDRIRNCSVDGTTSCKPYNEFDDTIPLMLSGDYKERFIAEYRQTKIRYERLKAFCNRIEASERTAYKGATGVDMPKHDCPAELLREQQKRMGEYLHILEVRAVIEGIEL